MIAVEAGGRLRYTEPMFLDEAVVEFSSGRGGDGAATFHREKHVPRGGPNGADGGRGGSVVLVADRSRRTLLDFKLRPKIRAQNGENARGSKAGKDADDVVVPVPVGTVVSLLDGTLVADLNFEGARVEVCRGGRGGRGNLQFVSSVRQAPRMAEKGEPGHTATVRLEVKLLADIGLVGLPNAGKSTLLSAISAARPKIADYPFTTLEPNLGVVRVGDFSFVVADLPGLIEGASEGHGLGHRFLRHAERTAALVHVVDVLPLDGSDAWSNFRAVEEELAAYSPLLAEKKRLVALNKTDLLQDEALRALEAVFVAAGAPVFPISAATGKGLEPLLYAMADAVRESADSVEHVEAVKVAPKRDDSWRVEPANGGFRVVGQAVERMVEMTDFSSIEAIRYLHRRLERIGLIGRLRELGAQEGDTVYVGEHELAFTDET